MVSTKIILLFTFLGLVISFNEFQISANNIWSCPPDRDFVECLKNYLRKDIKEENPEMCDEIAKSFANEKYKDDFLKNDEESKKKNVSSFVNKWRTKMIEELIKIYNIEADDAFRQEMIRDPEFYGLTFDSYKIMTYQFEDEKEEKAKTEEKTEKIKTEEQNVEIKVDL